MNSLYKEVFINKMFKELDVSFVIYKLQEILSLAPKRKLCELCKAAY